MTIASTTSRNTYTANGVTTAFPYTFKIQDDVDLLVTVRDTSNVETTKTLSTDYTVDGVGVLSGGNVNFLSAPTNNYVVTIRRNAELKQETDFRSQGDFAPDAHEDAIDRLLTIDQQQQDSIDRSVKIPETVTTTSFDPTLPADIAGAVSKVPITNSAGDGFDVASTWPSASDIANAASYASQAAVSAAAAVAAGGSVTLWLTITYKTVAASPYTVLSADRGKVFSIDASGGAVTIKLPQISGLTLTTPFSVTFAKSDSSANAVTIQAYNGGDGTNKINGANSITLDSQDAFAICIADVSGTPDEWRALKSTPLGAGSIGTTQLASAAVTTAKLASGILGSSQIIVDTGNGTGSTNTRIRRFSNTRLSTGSAITYADSAANGGSFTINTTGIYAINYSDHRGPSGVNAIDKIGISVNTDQPTTSINSVTYAHGRRAITKVDSGGSYVYQCSWVGRLSATDVVRAHTDNIAGSSESDLTMFSITQICGSV